MKKEDFINIIKGAALTAWKNKFLWIFGLLVLIGSCCPDYNSKAPLVAGNYFLLVIGSLVVLALCLALYSIRILAMAALIKSANNISVYKNANVFSILEEAKSSFWTLLFVDILLGIFLLAILLVITLPVMMLFVFGANVTGVMVGVLGVIIFIPIAVIVFFLREYAYLFAVIGKNKTRASLERAYDLFRNNVRSSILMAFFLILAILISWLALFFSLIFTATILCLIVALLFLINKIVAGLVVIVFLLFLVAFLVAAVSFTQSFLQTAWVSFFQKIAFIKNEKKPAEEPLVILENIADAGTI